MNTVLPLASALVCALGAHAQITATLTRLPSGREEIRVRNHANSDLVAFAVYARQASRTRGNGAPFVSYMDSLQPDVKPLPANGEVLVVARSLIPPGTASFEEPIITAGILDDGTTVGDETLLTRLLLRRCNLLVAVETTLDILLGAGSRNVPRPLLIGQFQDLANSLNRWYVPPEQQVARDLYQSMVSKLMNLPKGGIGSPFPPGDFVDREAALLTRQRSRLLESEPSLTAALMIPR